jgi:hypothetical protein
MASQQSGEAELAIYVGSKIADGLVGGAADRLITGPILNLLGIKKTDNTAADYHQDIVQRLSALGQSLNDQIRDLQQSLTDIKSISTQIKDYLTQESLAQMLRDYDDSANTIKSLFELFVDDVSALGDVVGAASQTGQPNDALTDLYQNVLNADNAEKVSEAMSRIHDLLVKPSDFDKGILDYLKDMVTAEIQKYAETDANFVYKFTRSWGTTFNVDLLDRNFQYYDCGKIVVNGHQVARAAVPNIAALFERIVAIQLRGLLLLSKAWQESPHAPTLGLRLNEVMESMQLMKSFYPVYKSTVDVALRDTLKANGKYFTDDFLHSFGKVNREVLSYGNQTDPGGFLNHDWIMMRVEEGSDEGHPFDRVWLVYQPWTDASKLPAGADRYCLAGRHAFPDSAWLSGLTFPPSFPQEFLDGNVNRGNYEAFDRFIYPGLNPLPTDAPPELAAVVDGLPSSVDAAVKDNLMNLLTSSSFRAVPLSFKCELDGQNIWLQGHPATGSLSLAPKRDAIGSTSTAWRVFFTLMPPDQLRNVCLKCLGFNEGQDKQYLNGPSEADKITASGVVQIGPSKLELTLNPDPEISKGTEWIIQPWPDNTISITRAVDFVDTDGTVMPGADVKFLEGKADGSVALSNWAAVEDKDHMKWIVYPYIEDGSD